MNHSWEKSKKYEKCKKCGALRSYYKGFNYRKNDKTSKKPPKCIPSFIVGISNFRKSYIVCEVYDNEKSFWENCFDNNLETIVSVIVTADSKDKAIKIFKQSKKIN